jgi:endonuclease YncB( thermonuclease family)
MALAVLPATTPPAAPTPDWSAETPAQTFVVAGDLLLVRGQPIRLAGIAAPLPAQRCDTGRSFTACGATATRIVREIAASGAIKCRILGLEVTPWTAAKPTWIGGCQVRGLDLAEELVRAGYALPAPGSPLFAEGLDACTDRRGIWGWSVESPWTFAARREGQDIKPVFIGARSGTPCLRALAAPDMRWRSLIPR